jgi:hypothetical protein
MCKAEMAAGGLSHYSERFGRNLLAKPLCA